MSIDLSTLTEDDIQKMSTKKIRSMITQLKDLSNTLSDNIKSTVNNIETLRAQNISVSQNYDTLIANAGSTDCKNKTLEIQSNHDNIMSNLTKQINEAKNEKMKQEQTKEQLTFECTNLHQDIKEIDKESANLVKSIPSMTNRLRELCDKLYTKVKSLSITMEGLPWASVYNEYSTYRQFTNSYNRHKSYQQDVMTFWNTFGKGMELIDASSGETWANAGRCSKETELEDNRRKLKPIVQRLINDKYLVIDSLASSGDKQRVNSYFDHLYWNVIDDSHRCYSSFYSGKYFSSTPACQRGRGCSGGGSSGERDRTSRDNIFVSNTINNKIADLDRQYSEKRSSLNHRLAEYRDNLTQTSPYATLFDGVYNTIINKHNEINNVKSAYRMESYGKPHAESSIGYTIIAIIGVLMLIIFFVAVISITVSNKHSDIR